MGNRGIFMKQENKIETKIETVKQPKVITGQNVENGLNYRDKPVINDQIKTSGTAILG